MPPTRDSLIRTIEETCARDPRARLAYLYGSYADGTEDGESDIDVAVLADSTLDKKERLDVRLDLMSSLTRLVGATDTEVDVVILQDVSVLLKFNVIRKGVPAFERDRSERILFELKTEQEMDDEWFYLKRENDYILKKILSMPMPS